MIAVANAVISLVAFDGTPGALSTFKELNDPVMGGQSTGNWTVQSGHGIFDGNVADVPSLKAPGFIKAAADGTFPDASAAAGGDLVLKVRSSTPDYAGFRVAFAAGTLSPSYACAGGGSIPLSRGCYKASFSVPAGDSFAEVRVPFSSFSDKWSPATGEPTATCATDKSTCVTAKQLAKILRVEVWAEGKKGKVHLELEGVAAAAPAEAALAEAAPAEAAPAQCPPAEFTTQGGFDLEAYIADRWYIQQQMQVSYLPKDKHCVYAEYRKLAKPTFWGYDLAVHNIAGSEDSGDLIYAKVVDGPAGKLEVAPWFLPAAAAGPYWVLAYDEAAGYALVSGGPPTHAAAGGCRTGTGVNKSGLWIFTRRQARDQALVDKVRDIARAKGFDLSVLQDIDQTNCNAKSSAVLV